MKKKYFQAAETGFAIFGLLFFSDGGLNIGGGISGPGIFSETTLTILRYFVWGTSGLLLCLRWKKALLVASKDLFIWPVTAILVSSYGWSIHQDFTLKFIREIWQMTTFGLYLATTFTLKQQVKLVAGMGVLGALMSTYFALRVPAIGLHHIDHPGAWRGIYDYKNTFGSIMVLGGLAFFLYPVENRKDRWIRWGGYSMSMVMMLLSTSKTSLVLSFLLLAILVFYRNFRWKGKISVIYLDITILFVGCIVTFVFSEWIELLHALGKDPTLSGRTEIWGVALTQLQDRFWFGFGRGAFWAPGSKFALAAGHAVDANYVPPHAHNGFIDLALDSGFVGLSFFLVSFFIAYFRAIRRAYGADKPEDVWPLGYLLFLFINNISESYLERLTNVYWVLYLAVSFSVCQRKK